MRTRLLNGIKVIDMSTFVAGPCCAKILGEWGAEVIKIESPKGDLWRYNGNESEDENPIFATDNYGKRFLSVDMKKDEGAKIVYQLLGDADIFITNFREEALERLNLTYGQLSKKYPKLIYAHVQGYGKEGPLKDKPGYDSTAFFARSGILLDIADEGKIPCNSPATVGDHVLALCILSGILAALYSRTKTGKGDLVTSGLYQSAIYLLSSMLVENQLGIEYPMSRKKAINPLSNTYQCKDGLWLMVGGTNYYAYLPNFSRLTDLPELIENKKYNSPMAGLLYTEEITAIIEKRIRTKNRDEWIKIFEDGDFPCEILQHIPDVLNDEQAWDNNYLREVTFPTGNTRVFAKTPVDFASQNTPEFKNTTKVGGNTREILKEMGYTDGDIKALQSKGAIIC